MKVFPFELEIDDAKMLIQVSDFHFRNELINEWGYSIAMDQTIRVNRELYERMRHLPNTSLQNALDKIFGPEAENKNPWQNDSIEDITSFSRELFGGLDVIQIARSAANSIDRPDLEGRSFYISTPFEVITHKTLSGGTVIEIVKKFV